MADTVKFSHKAGFPTLEKKKWPRHAQTHLEDTPRNTHKQVINTRVMGKLVLKTTEEGVISYTHTYTHNYTPRRLQSRSKYFLKKKRNERNG